VEGMGVILPKLETIKPPMLRDQQTQIRSSALIDRRTALRQADCIDCVNKPDHVALQKNDTASLLHRSIFARTVGGSAHERSSNAID